MSGKNSTEPTIAESAADAPRATLTPRFVERPAFRVMGVVDDLDKLEHEDPGFERIWFKRFMPLGEHVKQFNEDGVHYNVHWLPPGASSKRFLACMAVNEEAVLPKTDEPGWIIRDVPAARYAVFDTNIKDVGETWDEVLQQWLPNSEYEEDLNACSLDRHPKGLSDEKPETTIWLAVKPKGPRISREDRRVWIEGIPKPNGSVSSIAVLTTALQQRGEHVDYTYLMGLGGRAFRLQFNWCGSGPHAEFGFNCVNPAVAAMGYERVKLGGTYDCSKEPAVEATPEQQEETRAVVKAEIEAGRAVTFGSEEAGLLVGYEPISDDNPTGWLRKPGPHGGGKRYMRPIRNMPWELAALRKVSEPLSVRDAAIVAIRIAIASAESGIVEGSELQLGFAAWEKWLEELQPDEFKAMVDRTRQMLKEQGRENEDVLVGICNGNAWSHENLNEARQAAASYLRRIADDMPDAARPHILTAANAYDRVADVMSNDSAEDGTPCAYTFVPYAFRLKKVAKEWTDEHRALQRRTLAAALVHERAAVDALKSALAIIDEQGAKQ